MPDDWANWGGIWKAVSEKYSVKHADTAMSSAEELTKFEAGELRLMPTFIEFDRCALELRRAWRRGETCLARLRPISGG